MKKQIIILLLGLGIFFAARTSFVYSKTSASQLIINGITINNITKNPLAEDSEGNLLISDEAGFQILYMPKFKHEFLLSIQDTPFNEYRQKAERKLIELLDVSKEDACWLYVVETTSVWINPDEAGKNYPLSFCKSKKKTTTAQTPIPTGKEAKCSNITDINTDGSTNSIDYAIAIQQYNQKSVEFDASLPRFRISKTDMKEDVNCDGIVDSIDLSIILDNLGTITQGGSNSNIIL